MVLASYVRVVVVMLQGRKHVICNEEQQELSGREGPCGFNMQAGLHVQSVRGKIGKTVIAMLARFEDACSCMCAGLGMAERGYCGQTGQTLHVMRS